MPDAAAIDDKTTYWRASINGLGPTQIGMGQEALIAHAGEIEKQGGDGEGCEYFSPINGEKDVSFMFYQGRLVRIDVYSRKTETISGVRVGDTSENIQRMYDGSLRLVKHEDDESDLLYLESNRPELKNYRMVFEINNNIVTDYRLGLLPYVNWQKGCAGER